MLSCYVSWKDSNDETRKGVLIQFVHDSPYYTYGIVVCDKSFHKVLYSDLTFERW